ncbi:TonB-dependent receptor [Parahaliea aestuarii]
MLATATPALAQQKGQATVLEEVLVTAQRREQNLQRTSVSVTALGRQLLEDADLPELTSLENLVPNLNFRIGSDGGNSTMQAFIRGVGQFDFAVTTDPGVGMYIDGVFQSRTIGANLEFADIEQVQVLRGPQGTLYGKNTIGGAINIVTRRPGDEFDLDLKLSAGSYQHREVSGYLSLPLIENTLSASVAFIDRESDGWQERRGPDAGGDDMSGGRAHLLWRAGDSFDSHLVVDAVHQRQEAYPQVLAAFNPAQTFPFFFNTFVTPGDPCCTPNTDIDKSNVLNDRDVDDLDSRGASWTNTWHLESLQLQSITGYRKIESDIGRETDNDPADYNYNLNVIDTEQFSQEFLLSGLAMNDRLDWVAGLYYLSEDASQTTNLTVAGGLFEALSSLPLDVTTPTGIPYRFLATALDLSYDYNRVQDTTSYAAYFHAIYSLTEQLRLTLAARYTDEKKELDVYSVKRASQTPILAPGPTDDGACSDVVAEGPGSRYQCEQSWTEVSPKIGLEYDINDDLMAYVSVSQGFRSGAFNGRPTATNQISVADPEIITSYELGLKSQWLARRLILNGSVFFNDYEDQQFLVNRSSASLDGGLALIVDNAGSSSITGAEIELSALPTEGLTLTASLGWIDAEFDTFDSIDPATGLPQDLSGRPFADTPELTWNLMAQYDWFFSGGSSLKLLADVYYKDDVYYSNDEASESFDTLHADGFATWNAGLIYSTSDNRWQFALHGRNLGDEREIVGGFGVDAFGITNVAYTAPRRYYASVRYQL